MTVAIVGTTVAVPDAAQARWGGGWHGGGWGGGWRGGGWGGGWGWGGFGVGLGTGLLFAAATAPWWGGYGFRYFVKSSNSSSSAHGFLERRLFGPSPPPNGSGRFRTLNEHPD